MDRLFIEWIKAFGIAVIIVVILLWIIWPMQVDGDSMEPTLSDGDFILVSKLWTKINQLETGDLVVVYLEEQGKREKIVKRIIGVEGDHVVIKNGEVSVNAKVLVEPYSTNETNGNIDLYVPKNGYFLLGDNRGISKDSRSFGCVYNKSIRGKLVFKKTY